MIVGNSEVFAVESAFTEAHEERRVLGIGFFALHVLGEVFGVRSPEATTLACSFDEVTRRAAARGQHHAAFMVDSDAMEIAVAIRRALYSDVRAEERFFRIIRA